MVETVAQNHLPLRDYGGMTLPEFSEDEAKLRAVDLSIEAFDACDPYQLGLDKMEGKESSRALRTIDTIVERFVLSQVKEAGIGGELLTHVERGLVLKKFEGVESSSPEKFALRELNARANRLKFKLIQSWIDEKDAPGLSSVAKEEFTALLPAMAATDRLAIKILIEEFPIDAKERTRRGMTNECAVVREDSGGEVKEVLLHDAYSEEVQAIVNAYQQVLSNLRGLPLDSLDDHERELVERKIFYYEVVLKAYETSDPKVWKEADCMLKDQVVDPTTDVLCVHQIETNYLGDPILRFPETSLRTPDLDAVRAQEIANQTQQTMLANLANEKYFPNCQAIKDTIGFVEEAAVVFYHFTGSGLELEIKPKGQALPNEFDSREKGGVSISLDISGEEETYARACEHFKTVFGEKTFAQCFPNPPDSDKRLGRRIASHELGHLIGLKADTYERIGSRDLLVNPFSEEWKASSGGLVGNEWISYLEGQGQDSPEVDLDDLKEVLSELLLDCCRFSSERHKPGGPNYFRESMIFMQMMERIGILQKSDASAEFPWEVDMSQDNVEEFFKALTQMVRSLVDVYGEGGEYNLRAWLLQFLQVSEVSRFMCDRIPTPTPVPPEDMLEWPPYGESGEDDDLSGDGEVLIDEGIVATREDLAGESNT